MESRETEADSGNKGTGEFDSAKWKTLKRQHIDRMVQRQANSLGCHCPDTYAESDIGDTATEAGAARHQAATKKIARYDELACTRMFYPGTCNH